MSERTYPVLNPPTHLTNVGPCQSWSIELAQENYDWIMSVRRKRIDDLLDFFGCALPERGQEYDFLVSVGSDLGPVLRSEPNWRDGARAKELTAPGLSMAYDMGLLIGELLIAASDGTVRWELFRGDPLSPEFNLPALAGRRKDWRVGVNRVCIVEATAVMRAEESEDVWARDYRAWFDQLTRETQLPTRLRPGSKLSGTLPLVS